MFRRFRTVNKNKMSTPECPTPCEGTCQSSGDKVAVALGHAPPPGWAAKRRLAKRKLAFGVGVGGDNGGGGGNVVGASWSPTWRSYVMFGAALLMLVGALVAIGFAVRKRSSGLKKYAWLKHGSTGDGTTPTKVESNT